MKFFILSLIIALLPIKSYSGTIGLPINYELHIVSKEAHIDIRTKKVAHVVGGVDASLAMTFDNELILTSFLQGPRVIIINSRGGYEDAGQKIIDSIEFEKTQGIQQICVVNTEAGSMAFNILSHCDIRLATEKSKLMFHKLAYDSVSEESFGRLTPNRLRSIAAKLEQDDEVYKHYNAKKLHMSLKTYDIHADNDTDWVPKTLLKNKYLDGICTID